MSTLKIALLSLVLTVTVASAAHVVVGDLTLRDLTLRDLTSTPLLPAIAAPALIAQVPDPNHEGHKMQPDGQSCKPTGPNACHCTVNSCERDDQGKVTSWHASSSCNWYCKVESCDCHACLEGECPDGPH